MGGSSHGPSWNHVCVKIECHSGMVGNNNLVAAGFPQWPPKVIHPQLHQTTIAGLLAKYVQHHMACLIYCYTPRQASGHTTL